MYFDEKQLKDLQNEQLFFISQKKVWYKYEVKYIWKEKKKSIEVCFSLYEDDKGYMIETKSGSVKKEVKERVSTILDFLTQEIKNNSSDRLHYLTGSKKIFINEEYYNQIREEHLKKFSHFYLFLSHSPILIFMIFLHLIVPKIGLFVFVVSFLGNFTFIVYNGLQYISSQGDPKAIEQAKMKIFLFGSHSMIQCLAFIIGKVLEMV